MKLTTDQNIARKKLYVPPPLGNGDLQLQIDAAGSMEQINRCGLVPGIHRAGIRYDDPEFGLVPFGYFRILPDGEERAPETWTQTLDTRTALLTSEAVFPDGTKLFCESFCCLTRNIVVLRRRLEGGPRGFRAEYHCNARRMRREGNPGTGLKYELDDLLRDRGVLFFFSDRETEFVRTDTCWESAVPRTEACFYLCFGEEEAEYARKTGYEGLFREHASAWRAYHEEGFIAIPSESLWKVYESAVYHLRIISTKWSIPVGLFESHWHGRYFAFDESFVGGGLLTAGHFAAARKPTEFRRSHLDAGRQRASGYCAADGSARWVWEATERPGLEGAPPGHWNDHIFHMSMTALLAWETFEYTEDMEYLRGTAYPVIRACAEFYRIQSCYEHNGTVTVGKCCDLERLGPAHENPFLTVCGVIANFEIAADAAERLNADSALVPLWRKYAAALRENLPNDGTKYLPYSGCTEKSVAVLGALFPFNVLDPEDPLLRNAADDFFANASEAGNMYPVGKSVCIWYAVWMALALLRMDRAEEALVLLESAVENTGCFSEIFEIYETKTRPWFSTGEGVFLRAVNELLLSGKIERWKRKARYHLPEKKTALRTAHGVRPV